jgi:hypothetical protein
VTYGNPEEPLGKDTDRICGGFPDDLSRARSDVEAGEIRQGYQIGTVNFFPETAVSGTSLVQSRKPLLGESFCVFERIHLIWAVLVLKVS